MTAPRVAAESRRRAGLSLVQVLTSFRQLTFLGEDAARLIRARRVNRCATLFDMLDNAFLVYDERGARAVAAFFIEDAVVAHGRAFEIAEERERDSNLLCEFAVGGNTVDAKTKNLSVGGFEFRDISLIRF